MTGETLKVRRVLLLASYCGSDDRGCTDKLPCPACLPMCNVAEVFVRDEMTNVKGGWRYLRASKRLRVVSEEPRFRRKRFSRQARP